MMKKRSYDRYIRRLIIYLIAVLAALAADLGTKQLAVSHLKGGRSFVLLPGVFELVYVENRGAAFGMMQGGQWLFVAIAVLIFAACAVFFVRSGRTYWSVCFVLLGAGALGNMADRLCLGYVRDFLYFSLIDFPVFNVADIYVTVSCALLIVLTLTDRKGEDNASSGRT